uniref:(northern house mosquito) hypothetical protein n=1 Tax=Culex pipiens TaxID=7175 RepID=A0A8D8CWF1_CULPI
MFFKVPTFRKISFAVVTTGPARPSGSKNLAISLSTFCRVSGFVSSSGGSTVKVNQSCDAFHATPSVFTTDLATASFRSNVVPQRLSGTSSRIAGSFAHHLCASRPPVFSSLRKSRLSNRASSTLCAPQSPSST